PEVTGVAAVGYLLLGQPDLLYAGFKVTLEGNRVDAPADEVQILFLVTVPLVEVALGGSNGKQNKQNQARGAKGARAISEEEPPGLLQLDLH
ncbi:MAG TPA: hypothetical protein VF772_10150, partial [Terriglobales bacterium]